MIKILKKTYSLFVFPFPFREGERVGVGWRLILTVFFGLAVFVVFSAVYGFLVYIRPEKITSAATPRVFGFDYKDLELRTIDGLKLAAWYVPAQKSISKAIILLHGYPADKGDILHSLIFLRKNYDLLFLDFRHFGQSEGKYSTIGIREVQDILAAVKYLQERGIKKIGVWGFSMGGAAGLMALPETDKIQVVVSDSSYASLRLMAEEVYRQVPGLNKIIAYLMGVIAKVTLNIDIAGQSPLEATSKVKTPILFIHAQDDEVIPFRHAEMLKEASRNNPNAEFWFPESGAHGGLGSREYQEKVSEFFQKTL